MAIKYRLVEKPNSENPNAKPEYVPEIVGGENFDLEAMIKKIANEKSIDENELRVNLTAFFESMDDVLSRGISVELNGFGTLHPTNINTFAAPGMRNNANAEIMNLNFEPDSELLDRLNNTDVERVD